MSAPMIREEFRDKFNIIISPEQAKIARRIVLDKLQAECNEHFARLNDYEMELLRKRRHLNMEQAAQEQAIEDVSSTAPPATQA
ncbi:hypothetical protein F2Q68_00030262 [Brassica cretica]|uniref:Uncharacterized protein n=1 Tax=Brassica cretica TaxID=69181 RepID=A0A8S9G288_BRACR|nr:hypothetical protein F2Q68_00030262 [Brassica cretica]